MKKAPQHQNIDHQEEQQQHLLEKDHYQDDGKHNPQQMEQQMEESQPIEQEQQEGNQQQQEYEEYGQFDEQGGDIIIQQINQNFTHRMSSESNTQCQMEDLVKIIDRETIKIMELTGFDQYWALIYYQTCGWRTDLVSAFIDEKLSSRKMISYKPQTASISTLDGTCDVCCLDSQIIFQNMCGDQFCQNCWKSHLTQKLKAFNTDPFPPCLNSQCKVKTSPFILQETGKNYPIFKKLYLRTLCRSYAIGNTSVKMCKGREKFSCDRCFQVKKLFEIIECQCCENIICGRCGQGYHYPSECFDGPNWRKVVEGSTNFIENLNYRICPSCKQAVQRSVGCNSMVCKCREMFCYICGQKWLPNHSQHGICYKEKEIRALHAQKKRKQQNQKEYIDKLEKFKAQIEKYLGKIKKIDAFNVQEIKNQLISKFKVLSNELDYLEPLRKKLRIALRIARGYVLSLYFNDNQVMKAELSTLVHLIEQSYDYLLQTLKDLIQADNEVGLMNKGSITMRKQIKQKKLIPQEFLARGKIQMLGIIKGMGKYMNN